VLREVLEELREALRGAADQRLAELDRILGDGAGNVAEAIDHAPEAAGRDAQDAEQAVDDGLERIFGELDESGGDLAEDAPGLLAQIGDALADFLDGGVGAVDEILVDALLGLIDALVEGVELLAELGGFALRPGLQAGRQAAHDVVDVLARQLDQLLAILDDCVDVARDVPDEAGSSTRTGRCRGSSSLASAEAIARRRILPCVTPWRLERLWCGALSNGSGWLHPS
jgi:hypothetical protein